MSQKFGLVDSSKVSEKRLQSESYAGGKLCEKDDLVLNRLKAHLGVFAHANQAGVVSPDYTVFRMIVPGEVRYFEYLFKTPMYKTELWKSTKGIVEGFWRLYTDDFYNIRVPVPPLPEQRKILLWISGLDTKVKEFVAKQDSLISLLTEQKQSIIHEHIVGKFKGDVPRKPSKNEWLDDIPAVWNELKLRYIAELIVSNVDKHTIDGERPVRLCNYTDVYRNEFVTDRIAFMNASATEEEIAKYRIRVGDVLITKDSELWSDIAVPALIEYESEDLLCGYHLAILRPNTGMVRGDYLHRVLEARQVITQLHLSAKGVTRFGLSQIAIKDCLIPIPPLDEQEHIVSRINSGVQSISRAIAKARREIELVREYRTRLLVAVLTGEIDVSAITIDQVDLSVLDEVANELESDGALDDEAMTDDESD